MGTRTTESEGSVAADDGTTVASGPTGTGLDSNVAGALSYLLGIVTGVVFFVVEPDDEFVRFHAAQSIATFGVLFAVYVTLSVIGTMVSAAFVTGGGAGFFVGSMLSLVLGLVWLVLGLASLGLWLYLLFSAYQGRMVRVPVAAGIADRLV
jgi:uncharacterized membrane protein